MRRLQVQKVESSVSQWTNRAVASQKSILGVSSKRRMPARKTDKAKNATQIQK